jgi:hypothetical protein
MIVDLHVHLPWELQDSEDMEVLIPAVENMLEAGKRAGIDKQVLLGQVRRGPHPNAARDRGALSRPVGSLCVRLVPGSR